MAQEQLSPDQIQELVRNGSITLASVIDAVVEVNAIKDIDLQNFAQDTGSYITSKIEYSDQGRRIGVGF